MMSRAERIFTSFPVCAICEEEGRDEKTTNTKQKSVY